ncbi:hypothetical protein F5B22DRAFT_644609 [Xylaria bambusicola]|uniref:uncharacterized protein n=1 Tax=Xylaria bambusicola TaxID=326684 RepID=UPI002007D5CF|nr:uncharacterized protein F5B22DRAFT_644609 [Xylaria bambusicola]KAI0520866.1 hypothetical protein F5B22DRAFT_644609 [Xylaria bambusicola]
MPSTNFYEVLGVTVDADVATINRAFRELSLKMLPDKANISTVPTGRAETPDEREAREAKNHERFVRIVEARDVLTDPTKRELYDLKHSKNRASSKGNRPSPNTFRPSSSEKQQKSTPTNREKESNKSKESNKPVGSEKPSASKSSTTSNKPRSHSKPGESTKGNSSNPPKAKKSEESKEPRKDSYLSGKQRLDIELCHDTYANNLCSMRMELNELLASVTPRSSAARAYPDYQAVVVSFERVHALTVDWRKHMDECQRFVPQQA